MGATGQKQKMMKMGERNPKKKPGMPGQARGHVNYFCKIGCIDLPMPCDACVEAKARHDRVQSKGNQKKNLRWAKSYRLEVERRGIAKMSGAMEALTPQIRTMYEKRALGWV